MMKSKNLFIKNFYNFYLILTGIEVVLNLEWNFWLYILLAKLCQMKILIQKFLFYYFNFYFQPLATVMINLFDNY